MRRLLAVLLFWPLLASGQAPVIITQPKNQRSIIGGSVTFVVGASGSPNLIVNGGFESDLAGWTVSGNYELFTVATYPASPTEGSKAMAFNTANRTPNAVFSQTVNTTAGQSYSLTFDRGVYSYQSTAQQILQVSVTNAVGGTITQTFSINGIGTGSTWITNGNVSFQAASSTSTITFQDVSSVTNYIDLLLDNIKLLQTTGGASGSPNLIVNGGFESDLAGWTVSGNYELFTVATYPASPTEGSKAMAFNIGNRTPNAVFSQTVNTTAGQSYSLTFDRGVYSYQSTAQQILQVSVTNAVGGTITQTFSINGIGTGSTWITNGNVSFQAASSTSTITFQDVSPVTNYIDLLLDNIKLLQTTGLLSYQWRKGGSNISGATASTYLINPIAPGNVGTYDVVVTNASGSTTSNSAILTLLPLLSKSVTNPRYFTDGTKAVYLTGEHIPTAFQDWVGAPIIDFTAFVNQLQTNNHNFLKLWQLDNPYPQQLDNASGKVTPLPYARPGPGSAADSLPKFDVSQLDQSFFDRLRARMIEAGSHGIYTSVMFANPIFVMNATNFTYSMYNPANNINGALSPVTNLNQYTMTNSTWVGYFDAFVDKVVDTLNDLDNVFYEVGNEGEPTTSAWQDHVIARVHTRESGKSKQHFIGKTSFDGNSTDSATNTDLLASSADWISLSGRSGSTYSTNVADAPGTKVSILDTDHIWGFPVPATEHMPWPWRSLTRGHNPIYITPLTGYPGGYVHYPDLEATLGITRTVADRIDLLHMVPTDSAASTGYALVYTNMEYLIFQPNNASFTVTLPAATFNFEWINPSTGATASSGQMNTTAGNNTFDLPSGMTTAVLHLVSPSQPTPTPTPAPTPTPNTSLTNGSFESDYTGWSQSGNQNIYTTAFAPTTDGTKGVEFNGGQALPNGVLSQTFLTTAGTVYSLNFDLGVTSYQSSAEEKVRVTVVGSGTTLLSQDISVFGIGTGTAFTPKAFTFTANSSSTTLSFTDISPATQNIDLLLDNVRVTSGGGSKNVIPRSDL